MLNIEPQPLFNVFIDRRRRAQMTHGDDDDPVPNVYNTDAGIHPFHQHINAFQVNRRERLVSLPYTTRSRLAVVAVISHC